MAKRPKSRVKATTGILRFNFWYVVFLWFVLGANSRRSTYNGTIRLSLSRNVREVSTAQGRHKYHHSNWFCFLIAQFGGADSDHDQVTPRTSAMTSSGVPMASSLRVINCNSSRN